MAVHVAMAKPLPRERRIPSSRRVLIAVGLGGRRDRKCVGTAVPTEELGRR